MKDQNVIIIEPNGDFGILLKSALESYGFENIDVLQNIEKHKISDSVRILSQETHSCLNKPIRFGSLLQELEELESSEEQELSIGKFRLDLVSNVFVGTNGKSVKLTEKERDILVYLAKSATSSASRQELLENIWGYSEQIDTHTLETHIYRLRQKIEDNASEPSYLKTENDGYFLDI